MALLSGASKDVYQKILIKENNFPIMADGSLPGAEFLSIFNSLPNNKVLYDQYGVPGVYVCIPKFNWDPTNGFASTEAHPAFIWDGAEHDCIWISKYQNVIINKTDGSILDTTASYTDNANYVPSSLPYQDPAVYMNFNEAVDLCDRKNSATMRANGDVFHLLTNAEWAAISIWCKQMWKDGLLANYCYGNNDYGRDTNAKGVTGSPLNPTLTLGSSGGSYGSPYYARWRTGSGGALTAHNLKPDGIFDLNGNVLECISGLQSPNANNGKDAFIIPDNDAAIATASQLKNIASSPSSPWEKIGEWNSLTDEDFSKENRTNFTLAGTYTLDDAEKLALIANSDITADYGGDRFYKPDVGENSVPFRGAGWTYGEGAGLWFMIMSDEVSSANGLRGFRSAFIGDIDNVS